MLMIALATCIAAVQRMANGATITICVCVLYSVCSIVCGPLPDTAHVAVVLPCIQCRELLISLLKSVRSSAESC